MRKLVNGIFALLIVGGMIASAGETSAVELDVGDCFDDPDDRESTYMEVEAVPSRDCSEPHDNEVYAVRTVSGSDWPGDEELEAFAQAACYEEFAPFVDRPYTESRLDIGWLAPTRASWEDHGDRTVACFVYDMQFRKLTGSMEGSGE